jgi:hypothetical protein
MNLLLICCLWVLASACVALLHLRYQYLPGVLLMIAAPLLALWIGAEVGWWAACVALLAFASMFRNPLRYFWARARELRPEIPK